MTKAEKFFESLIPNLRVAQLTQIFTISNDDDEEYLLDMEDIPKLKEVIEIIKSGKDVILTTPEGFERTGFFSKKLVKPEPKEIEEYRKRFNELWENTPDEDGSRQWSGFTLADKKSAITEILTKEEVVTRDHIVYR